MPPDVVVLLFDTARADVFRPWGGPHPSPTVERLAHEGTLYAGAMAPAPWTVPSHASMFSGALPTEHGVTGDGLVWTERHPSSPARAVLSWPGPWLPEVMRERGYRTWGASCNSWISRWGGFDRGFDEFLDLRPRIRPKTALQWFVFRVRRVLLGLEDRGGRQAVAEFSRRLASAGPEPMFAFINLMETHSPFSPPGRFYPFAPWRRRRTFHLAGGPDQQLSYNSGLVDPGPEYVRTLRALYYACGRYADVVLGRLIQAISERGRPTVAVVVADHGENLGEHGLFNHNSSLHQTLVHVPLLLWGSRVDLAAGDVEEPVSTLRLADWIPSVADGATAPLAPDGPPVSEYEGTHRHNGIPDYIQRGIEERNPRVPALVFNPGLAVVKGSLKYVAAGNGEASLFDLAADPGEDRDLLPARPGLAGEFEPFRLEWERRRAERPSYGAGEVAEGEIADHLRELGYIE